MVKFPRSIHAWTVALVVGAGSAVAGVPAGVMEVPLRTIAVGLSEDVTRIDAALVLTNAVKGTKVRVRMLVSAPGHTTYVFTSRWTRKVVR